MTTPLGHLEYRRLRAPRADREMLADPPLDEVAGVLAANVAGRALQAEYDVQGRTLAELSRAARRDLIAEARRWTSAYRDMQDGPADPSAPIFLAGHQPQLFHPGVWLKSFALGSLAERHGATAVNLLVDNDTVKSTTLRVPGGSVARPRWAEIPMDAAAPVMPYEERRVVDRALFTGFGGRVADRIAPLVPDPLVRDFWPLVVGRMQQTGLLGASLAQARHVLEGRWGLRTLEVPLSRVCRSEAFGWLVAHLLAQLPRLREVYNEVVRQYRHAHGIRSAAHPVPDLAAEDRWLEAPFWIWTSADPRRRRLFVRHGQDELVLSDRHALELRLPLGPDADAQAAVRRLDEIARAGVKIRPRALITTLWARLALGDLFVHGIGGAKYDQVTDALVEGFFGLKPPGFLVLSATLHLPIERRRASVEDARAIRQQLRKLTWHPEKYVDADRFAAHGACACGSPAHLIAEKARWIATPQTPESARQRCRAIRRINTALQPCVADRRRRLLRRQAETLRALRAEEVLSWREYGFCLYPEETLRNFLVGLLPKSG